MILTFTTVDKDLEENESKESKKKTSLAVSSLLAHVSTEITVLIKRHALVHYPR
jgi:hypothetical protein